MRHIKTDPSTLNYFPNARYDLDATFQQSNYPSGNMAKETKYFSEKHELYRYKEKISVLLLEICIESTTHSPKPLFDLDIFLETLQLLSRRLGKL